MHAGFQFVFGSFLPRRFAGATSNSGIFYILQNLGMATHSPRLIPVFSTVDDWLRCYRDT
jgi:hypothetical protein